MKKSVIKIYNTTCALNLLLKYENNPNSMIIVFFFLHLLIRILKSLVCHVKSNYFKLGNYMYTYKNIF